MKTQNKLLTLLSLGALAITFVGPDASAETAVSGSICEATDNGYTKQVVGAHGSVANKSTTATLGLNCPLAFYPWSYLNYLYVDYRKTSTASLVCSLHTRDAYNESGYSVSRSTTANGNGWLGLSGISTYYYTSVYCALPKAVNSTPAGRSVLHGLYFW